MVSSRCIAPPGEGRDPEACSQRQAQHSATLPILCATTSQCTRRRSAALCAQEPSSVRHACALRGHLHTLDNLKNNIGVCAILSGQRSAQECEISLAWRILCSTPYTCQQHSCLHPLTPTPTCPETRAASLRIILPRSQGTQRCTND
jgi:hypothetical protein